METIFDYNIKVRNCFLSRAQKYIPDIFILNYPQSDSCYFNKSVITYLYFRIKAVFYSTDRVKVQLFSIVNPKVLLFTF